MTGAEAAQFRHAVADAREAGAATVRADVGVFLGAVATMLRQTLERFEETHGRIAELVVTRSDRPDRNLVVALQDFDRLQQEFAALADVVAYFAATSEERAADSWADHHGHRAIAAISVADLRDRMIRHLRGATAELAVPADSEDVVF
jgi:hypothetical protein